MNMRIQGSGSISIGRHHGVGVVACKQALNVDLEFQAYSDFVDIKVG